MMLDPHRRILPAHIEAQIMSLAMMARDLRQRYSDAQLSVVPSLAQALRTLDRIIQELCWDVDDQSTLVPDDLDET